MIKREH